MPEQRLQKILSAHGICSRRQAEVWIGEGRVRVNGRVASLGMKADPDRDSIRVDDRVLNLKRTARRYLLVNKPKGYVTTTGDARRTKTVLDLVPPSLWKGLKPVGRLDVQTEGLLLLTNDGDFAQAVAHPSGGLAKEYMVKVAGSPTESDLGRIRRGLPVDGRKTAPCEVMRLHETQPGGDGNTWLRIVLHEGRSRQIRRMFEMIGHPVSKLKRTAIGPLRDARLAPGDFRFLTGPEIEALRRGGFRARVRERETESRPHPPGGPPRGLRRGTRG